MISSPSPIRRCVDRARPWRSTWKRWRRRGWTTADVPVDLVDQAVDVGHELVGRRRRCGRRRRRRAAARRSRAPDRPAARGCRATRAASAPAAGCATPRARPAASPHGTAQPAGSGGSHRSGRSAIGAVQKRTWAGSPQTYWRTSERSSWAAPMMSRGRRRRRRRSARRARRAASTALAHTPTDTPYGGTAGSSCGDEVARGRRARRGRRRRGPAGRTTRTACRARLRARRPRRRRRQHQRALLDGVEQLVDGRLGVGRGDQRRAVPAVRHLALDERLGERLAVAPAATRRARTRRRHRRRRGRRRTGRAAASRRSNSSSASASSSSGTTTSSPSQTWASSASASASASSARWSTDHADTS